MAAVWHINRDGLPCTHIPVCAWSEAALDRLPFLGDQKMGCEPITIAFLAGDRATVRRMLIYLGPWNPIVVTDREGQASHDLA
jgi:hypothetical protein